MNQTKLTVYFQDPFWVGVFERIEGGKLSAAKVTFGTEPKDCEVLEYVLKHYTELVFSPAVEAAVKEQSANPKRRMREARRQLETAGIGTKSQQVLKLLQEQNKQEHKEKSRAQKEAVELRRFTLKQQKKREKRRGH